jgi:hypothetical protein
VSPFNISGASSANYRPNNILVDAHHTGDGGGGGDILVFSDTFTDDSSRAYLLDSVGHLLSSFATPYGSCAAWDRSDEGASYGLIDWEWSTVGRSPCRARLLAPCAALARFQRRWYEAVR